ncbi:hypothetical protein [Sphingobacterium sp. UBA6645]|uniref:hypothetical protein n=1 Tax=Sphingobacterium sp. UBA6645 TaxID=1947511 RepID=UPI0025D3D918|nr:hypothetical protein [Sphingobacterium sp. UBA6645]
MKTKITFIFPFIFGFSFVSQAQQIDSLKRPDIYQAQVALHHSFKKSNKDAVFLGNSITFWQSGRNWFPKKSTLKIQESQGIIPLAYW